ncbi:MAG: PAS domain S-box protein [Sulfurospirillum sp.]|nr:PAS domain S-box protein [Sulfurospirillum sp.]
MLKIRNMSFTRRYIFALSIIAMLSAFAYFNLNHLISSQANDGKIINLSSKQGLLSQQIALYAIYYKTENLKITIEDMERAHELLMSFPMSAELKKIYFEKPKGLDQSIRDYLFHAKRFEENRDGRSLTYILQNSQNLLKELDLATSIFIKTTEESIVNLQNVELFIFLFTLLTLVFEALFIFRPATKKIIETTNEALREKNYSNTIVESNTNAIITLDKNLNIQTYNKMAHKLFGFSKEEIFNEPFFTTFIVEEDISQEFLNYDAFINIQNKEEPRELKAKNKNEENFPMRMSIGISGEMDEAIIIISIQDISKDRLKDKIMMQQAKFAALGEMIAIIAHQWRQPLAQLNFNCMYMRNKLTDPELIIEAEKNEEIIQFMSETITNFENFYRHTESELFEIKHSINQALKILDSSFKQNNISISKEIAPALKVYGNLNSLAQVILSIMQNSVDIMKSTLIASACIDIVLKKVDENIFIIISDNAGGIKASYIEDIFKPFHSNKVKPSTGIGLYMTKLIIENQFHGSISASNTSIGAQFTIQLSNN